MTVSVLQIYRDKPILRLNLFHNCWWASWIWISSENSSSAWDLFFCDQLFIQFLTIILYTL